MRSPNKINPSPPKASEVRINAPMPGDRTVSSRTQQRPAWGEISDSCVQNFADAGGSFRVRDVTKLFWCKGAAVGSGAAGLADYFAGDGGGEEFFAVDNFGNLELVVFCQDEVADTFDVKGLAGLASRYDLAGVVGFCLGEYGVFDRVLQYKYFLADSPYGKIKKRFPVFE
jgi:hypothetical protein